MSVEVWVLMTGQTNLVGEAQLARGIDHLRERETGLQGALPGSPNQNKDCLRRQSWDGALRPHPQEELSS